MITLAKIIGSPFRGRGHGSWRGFDPSILAGSRVGTSEYESL